MKKILTIGDSFTYGDELIDVNNAWPYLLGRKLGCEVTNRGVSASGNIKMVRSLVEENINDYDLVVIAWSGFDRIEFADEHGIWETWPGANRRPRFDSKGIETTSESSTFRNTVIDYINRHHNDNYLYRQQYLVQILLAQYYLKYHNKKYVMLDTFINHLSSARFDINNKDLVDNIDTTRFLGWPDQSMQEWTKGVPVGPRLHFLDEGHQIVANRIYNFLNA